jgi:signal transduction histidine kinase
MRRSASTPGDPRLPQMHAVIARQTEQLTRIVDDLLDVARITQGRIVLRREIVDMATILAQAIETSRPMIDGAPACARRRAARRCAFRRR